jgi:magnesium transporter
MINPLLQSEISVMLAENDEAGLRAVANDFHSASVAEFTEGLTVGQIWRVLDYAPLERQALILPYFPPGKQVKLIEGMGREHMTRLIEQMAPDDRADLLARLDPALVESLLPLVAQAERHDIRQLLSYPPDSAGAIMTTEYATLPAEITVSEAMCRLRAQAPDSETIYSIWILDAQRQLLGTVSLRQLVLAKPDILVGQLMQRDVATVRVDESRQQVARTLARYDVLAVPVVDSDGRLVGIVTHDDVMDVVVQEATNEVQRLGAVQPLVENYLEASFVRVWWKRAGWLSCLFVAELLTFSMLAHFEDAMASVLALSLFVPLCISTGGNSGAQAATLVTRAMALGQVENRDTWRVLRHELGMGITLGLTLGVIGFVRAALTPQQVLGNANRWDIALVISQAVAAICLWGTLVGSALPLIFRRLGFDPAFASSPFVATFVDVTGIYIYFHIAQIYVL